MEDITLGIAVFYTFVRKLKGCTVELKKGRAQEIEETRSLSECGGGRH